MHGNSANIDSAQHTLHDQLAIVVARHAAHPFRKPYADYNRAAFAHSMALWHERGAPPLILDSCCGVGLSTMYLAEQFPNHFVIGVDQSAERTERKTLWQGAVPDNFIRVRADLVDYWRLLHDAGVKPGRHYLLYPNPWPKIGQLQRRWHGHAVFPTLVALGGELECRSNWKIYIEEFAAALAQLSGQAVACESYAPAHTITPFERKYRDSGHTLWRCRALLQAASGT